MALASKPPDDMGNVHIQHGHQPSGSVGTAGNLNHVSLLRSDFVRLLMTCQYLMRKLLVIAAVVVGFVTMLDVLTVLMQ